MNKILHNVYFLSVRQAEDGLSLGMIEAMLQLVAFLLSEATFNYYVFYLSLINGLFWGFSGIVF
ncbi:hypothetical protein [Marinagarivorans algicola]|uniref:hypothetical protein n=1 Tax=Marinagarivorans algicola TaxID=1513270 RepID=UPI0006B9F5AF|nr:hypothetical protein [Marinagarivorans algicola]